MMTLSMPKRATPNQEPDGTGFTMICAWCDRVRHGLEWFSEHGPRVGPNISHGICPDCFDRQIEQLESRRARNIKPKQRP
jgi:hypothetical protein